MLISILALMIMIGSFVLILSNIREVARDTFGVMTSVASKLFITSRPVPNIALLMLWCLIFWLCFI